MRAPAVAIALVVAMLAATGTARAATVSVDDAASGEGDPVVFTISLDGAAPDQVQVAWGTSNGTALSGKDYEATTGVATIPAGQTTTTATVPTIADKLAEPAENFTLTLSNPSGATIGRGQAVGTIDNVALPGKCTNILTGTKKANTLTGTERSDLITGSDGNDTIFGLAGADCLDGGKDKDTIKGGEGDDELDGRGGKDKLSGEGGNDSLSGGGDGDTLDGGLGDDKINAGSGKNKVYGREGNDNIATQNGKHDDVDCGPGTKDKVRADPGDSVKNCEIRVAPK